MLVRKVLTACLLAAVAGVMPARAETILFSNLGPGDSYPNSPAIWFGFDTGEEGDPDYHFSRAVPFVAAATGSLATLDMGLAFLHSFGETGVMEVNLYAANGTMPGDLLETFTRAEPYDGRRPLRFRSVVHPLLVVGTTYFLEPTALGRTEGLWFDSYEEGTHLDVYRVNFGPFQQGALLDVEGAFRATADAAPVPEPATLFLVTTGLAAVGMRRRRARARTEDGRQCTWMVSRSGGSAPR